MAIDISHRNILGKRVLPHFRGCFYPILFMLSGKENMHEFSGEFEIRSDPITDSGVRYPRLK